MTFIFAPCIFILLIFFYQQMHLFDLTYKILNVKIYIKTFLYSHSYMFRSVQTIIKESILSPAKVTFVDTISKITSL